MASRKTPMGIRFGDDAMLQHADGFGIAFTVGHRGDAEPRRPPRASLTEISFVLMFRNRYYAIALSVCMAVGLALAPTQDAHAQQTGTIAGTVTDSLSGETLPGVNVVAIGTQRGSSTDADGEYAFQVQEGTYDVRASFVGYRNLVRRGVEVEAGETVRVNFSLVRGVQLDEVVAVGYSQRRAEDLTGSVSQVSTSEVEDLPVTGIDQALSGQVAGVQINQGNGVPGGGPQIRVRGNGSIGANNNPLYVIDGFALGTSSSEIDNPINDIPPSNIESITILKDASATAIYGSRGANGVVLVETKRGTAGGDLQVDVNTYAAVQQPPSSRMPEMMNARQFADWRRETAIRNAEVDGVEPDIPVVFQNPDQLSEGIDWMEEVTRNAAQYNFDVSVRGGSEDIRSFFSASYTTQEGILLGTDYERFSARANVDATISDIFSAGIRFSPTFTQRRQAAAGGAGRYEGGFGWAQYATPIDPETDENGNFTGNLEGVFNPDGSYNQMIPDLDEAAFGSQIVGNIFGVANPVQYLEQIRRDRETLRALGTAYLEVQPIEPLTLRSTFNVDYSEQENQSFNPSTLGGLLSAPPSESRGGYSNNKFVNWLTEHTLTYNETFDDRHSVEVIGGFTAQAQENTNASLACREFPDDLVQVCDAATRFGTGGSGTNASEWSLLSVLGRVDYSYDNRYLVTATVRGDGSSRFGAGNRWGTFPSAAIAWRASEEDFLQDVGFLSNLKLRFSYGETGNFNIGNYEYAGQVNANNYVNGSGTLVNGRVTTTLPNEDLGWEETREFNLGIDAGFFNSRVTTAIDLYRRDTDRLLLDVEVPQSSGFSSVTQNRGEIRNQGIEVSVTTQNVQSEAFSWETSLNVASNYNEVLDLGGTGPLIRGNLNAGRPSHITQEGEPLGQFYGWKIEGLYDSQEEIDNNPSYPGAIVGNLRAFDTNGDGQLTQPEDFVPLGNPYPDFTYGISNTVRYRNLDLRVLATGSYGGKRMRASREYIVNIDGVFNATEEYYEDRYISPEDPGDGMTPTAAGPQQSRLIFRDPNSIAVQDNSHLIIKNITLGYRVPNELLGQLTRRARIYGSVQNALFFSPYNGGNPQATNYRAGTVAGNRGGVSQQLNPGLDFSTYPVPRTFTVGLQLGF
jgi:TonB-linked SusC/RagA family outer membrane protein